MRIIVVGGGIAGLGTALACARDGHQVTILERDDTPMPADADAAFAWKRTGAPQVRHSHAFLAGCATCCATARPTCSTRCSRRARPRSRSPTNLPETLTDQSPRARRRRARRARVPPHHVRVGAAPAACSPSRASSCATASPRARSTRAPGTVPRRGRRRRDPGRSRGRRPRSALVVGRVARRDRRRAPAPRSCTRAASSTSRASTASRADVDAPPFVGPTAADLGYLKYAIFLGDNHTFSITFAIESHDDELRRALVAPEGFETVARSLVAVAPWRADGVADPITDVHVMAGLRNRYRPFVDGDGTPLVHGFVAVGDASVCTNPLYGRGCSLAFVHAFGLADALRDHGDDLDARRARVRELHRPRTRAVVPFGRAAGRAGARDARGAAGRRPAGVHAGRLPRRAAAGDADVADRVPRLPALVQPLGDARHADGRPRDRGRGPRRVPGPREPSRAARPRSRSREPAGRPASTSSDPRPRQYASSAARSRSMSATCGRIASSSDGSYAQNVSARREPPAPARRGTRSIRRRRTRRSRRRNRT